MTFFIQFNQGHGEKERKKKRNKKNQKMAELTQTSDCWKTTF